MRRIVLILAVFLCVGATSCGDDTTKPPPTPFEQAKSRWLARGLADYSIDQTRACFCPTPHSYVVVVRNGAVADVIVENPEDHDAGLQVAMTVVDVFDVIQEAMGSADSVDAQYDSQTGFPIRVFIDYDVRIADEEFNCSMQNLQELEP